MSEEIKINRPPQQQPPAHRMESAGAPEGKQSSSKAPWVVLGVVVVVLIVVGVLFRGKLFGARGGTAALPNDSGYQAVFLSNGQVYFGKLADANSDYPVLTDIYYLQVVQPPLQGSNQSAPAAAASQAQPQISLVKLGNELHGPEDEMHIAKSQILFYEDMKSDSQVFKAIESYKANNK